MKKALTTSDARALGKEAGLAGKAKEACPFDGGELRKAWMDGHRKNATATRVDLSTKAEPNPEPVVEVAPVVAVKPEPPKETPAPAPESVTPAPQVTQDAPKAKGKPKGEREPGNPFGSETLAGKVTARLLTGAALDITALFEGLTTTCPQGIISDLRRKKLPLERNEAGQYFLANKGVK